MRWTRAGRAWSELPARHVGILTDVLRGNAGMDAGMAGRRPTPRAPGNLSYQMPPDRWNAAIFPHVSRRLG
jgi:hypothetical protein